MIRIAAAMALIGMAAAVAPAQPATRGCVVIQPLQTDTPTLTGGDQCRTSLSPASTYKIPHALIALETGVVDAHTVINWDGRKYERQAKWNQDHTVISALRPSALWVFQQIAPRVGAARAAQWLDRFDYGNQDTSGPVEQYWVNGTLAISAAEQVAFLTRFFRGTLPVEKRHADAVREGLRQQIGSVENARGVHRLPGDWRRTTLWAKTGATSTEEYGVSWLVGLLQSAGHEHVFASVVWKERGEVDALEAARRAAAAFVEQGLLPRSP